MEYVAILIGLLATFFLGRCVVELYQIREEAQRLRYELIDLRESTSGVAFNTNRVHEAVEQLERHIDHLVEHREKLDALGIYPRKDL